ncbi:hypothetical protein EDD17DRAFT_1750484 [Pisolithus thermaeus]|nr:hypothetical protein EDD17DRAFT_1750484 [Pisolithus thermaeus]
MQWLSCAGPSPPGHFNPSDRVAFDFEDALYIQSSSFLKYSVPGMTILSTCPNNGVPGRCNNEVSAAKPTGNKSTWAAQNPRWPVMQPHQSLSTVEKEHCSAHAASRQISAAQQKDHDALLNKAIQSLADEFEAKVQVLAMTHNVTHEKVKKLLGSHKYYRNPCSTQLVNAIIHDKAHEVNKGNRFPAILFNFFLHSTGHTRRQKLSLQQIRDLVKVNPKYQEMTQDEKDELLRALTEYQALKNTMWATLLARVLREIRGESCR